MSAPLMVHELAVKIADGAARADIECNCLNQGPLFTGWYDTGQVSRTLDDREVVDDAVRYLDLRGLLERNPDEPHLVRPKGMRP